MTLLYYLNWLATKRFALRFVGLLILIPTVLTVFFMSQVEADQTVSEVAPIKRSELSPQKALLTHRGELSDLQMRKVRLEGLKKKILDEIEAHDTENTAFSQLLLVSHPRIENLENAIVRYRLAISTLNSRLEMLRKRSEAASNLFEQAGSRIEMVEEQIRDLLTGFK